MGVVNLQLAKTASDFHPDVLADIYQDDIAITIWRRLLSNHCAEYAHYLLRRTPCFQTRSVVASARIKDYLAGELPLAPNRDALVDDINLVAQMFACLFDLSHVGLRMAVLNKAMCPKFHVDRVPCRLITTYAGPATEWLTHKDVERLPNGAVQPLAHAKIHQLASGDVALIKGEAWQGNEGRGLVHRSPHITDTERRLVLTLDFA